MTGIPPRSAFLFKNFTNRFATRRRGGPARHEGVFGPGIKNETQRPRAEGPGGAFACAMGRKKKLPHSTRTRMTEGMAAS